MVVDFRQDRAKRPHGWAHAIVMAAGGRTDRLEEADHIHHGQALGIADEAIAAPDTAHGLDQPGLAEPA